MEEGGSNNPLPQEEDGSTESKRHKKMTVLHHDGSMRLSVIAQTKCDIYHADGRGTVTVRKRVREQTNIDFNRPTKRELPHRRENYPDRYDTL